MNNKSIEARVSELEGRVTALEQSGKDKKVAVLKVPADSNYSGATGGIRLLIKESFFKAKRDLAAVKTKLTEKGYHYSSQAIHEALKRLSKNSGLLVVLDESGKKVYAERK